MAYATADTMVAAFGDKLQQALSVAAGADVSANAQLLAAIDAANDEADGYLRKRYTVPVTADTGALVRHCNSLAFYYLLVDTRPELVGDATLARRDNAIGFFKDCAKGLVTFEFEPENRMETINTVETVQLGAATVSSGALQSTTAPWFKNW